MGRGCRGATSCHADGPDRGRRARSRRQHAGADVRAPHILCLNFKDGMPAGLIEGLAAEGIHVAARLGRMRISPHVYNDEADADRFVAALARRVHG